MYSPAETVWYFAYGSNMSSAKFTGGRGIVPLDAVRVRIPNWVLTMEIPGMPYSEPSFSSIVPRDHATLERGAPDVIGVAYLITRDQYRHVIASEGGGSAYRDIGLVAEPVDGDGDTEKPRVGIRVRTLGSAISRHPPPTPSQRYMNLLKEGSQEARLPPDYQEYLANIPVFNQPESQWSRLGAAIFVFLCGPVMQALEKLTKKSIQPDGNAHYWVILIVRWTMHLIWVFHDYLFAPVFGRGDGL